ncbi:MAG: glutamate ABC transporter substrate-binding protein [Dehalococcoidia bacterium]
MRRAAWFVLAVGVVAALVSAACGDDDTGDGGGASFAAGSAMARIVESGRLTVGVTFDQPGFGLEDATTGRLDGFDVALGRAIGDALGLDEEQVSFVEVQSGTRIPSLNEGRVDLVIATMTITEERRREVDFSRPYFLAGQSLLVRRENTSIRSVGDLNGRIVCTVPESTSERNVRERAAQAELLTLEDFGACVAALNDGRAEAVTSDDVVLAGFAREDPSLKLAGGVFSKEPYGVALKQGQAELVEFVDGVIESMLEDGRWERLYEEHLGGIDGLRPASEARAAVAGS